MGIFFYFLLVCFSLIFPSSKLLARVNIVFIWIVYAFNTYTLDGVVYESIYDNFSSGLYNSHFEPAFSLIMYLCSKIGLSFQGFRVILASIFTPLIYSFVRRNTRNKAYALGLFMVYPLLFFVSVLRAGIASAIILYSISYLYEDEEENGVIKYFIGVVFSTLFHYSSIFFLLLILAKQEKSFLKSYVFFICIFIVGLVLNYTNFIYFVISQFTQREKILIWFSLDSNVEGRPNLVGFLTAALVLVGNTCLTWLLKFQYLKYYKPTVRSNPERNNIIELSYNTNILMLVFIPFLLKNTVFIRLVYEILGVTIISCSVYLSLSRNEQSEAMNSRQFSLVTIVSFVWITIIALYSNYGFHRGTDYNSLHVITDNLLIGI